MSDPPGAADRPPGRHWFEPIADHLGEAYLRYSFTRGTADEIAFLTDALEVSPGARLLDVGCGPGRHAVALAGQGYEVVGVDISESFLDLARRRASEAAVGGGRATFARHDARRLPFDGEFDGAYSVCQGGFGLLGGPAAAGGQPADDAVLGGMARALRPGGRLVVSAFSAYFQVRHLEGSTFDAATGTNHETTEVLDPDGAALEVDLWTTCFTPRELRLLAAGAGLEVLAVHSATPGRYRASEPDIDDEELLLVARRPL